MNYAITNGKMRGLWNYVPMSELEIRRIYGGPKQPDQVSFHGVTEGGHPILPDGALSMDEKTFVAMCATELRLRRWTVEQEIADLRYVERVDAAIKQQIATLLTQIDEGMPDRDAAAIAKSAVEEVVGTLDVNEFLSLQKRYRQQADRREAQE